MSIEKGAFVEKINYQKKLESILEHLPSDPVPRLLLHSCCGPCSTYVLEYLSDYFEISVYYFNPNIDPPSEYAFREAEQQRLIAELPTAHPVHFLRAPYDPSIYDQAVQGHESDPERGPRCTLCFNLRLRAAAEIARAQHFDYFTTTLSISPHKDAQLLNRLGERIGREYGVPYLPSDFKKKNGFKRSTELTAAYGMYRQDYCGCRFSRLARDAQCH